MSAAELAQPVSATETNKLLQPFAQAPALILAVSGGADSTALLVLAARWRAARKAGPKLVAVTIDHALRPESAAEARAVKRLARRLGVQHRTLRWGGPKPRTGLQEAARIARYRLLAAVARSTRARHILTAHTLDDQAETVLFRMSRGSGMSGLCGMREIAPLPFAVPPPGRTQQELLLVRPFLATPKARLVATLQAAGIPYVEDASNRDPRFARSRLRQLLPALAREGLDAGRIALFARRLQRAETALEAAVDLAAARVLRSPLAHPGPAAADAESFFALPAEIAIRLLARAVAKAGNEGPAKLGKLEALYEALAAARQPGKPRLRRTLAGAMVTLSWTELTVETAPARRRRGISIPHAGLPSASGRSIRNWPKNKEKNRSLGRRWHGA